MPNPLTYLDFEIDVYPNDARSGYVVAVVKSPAGEARESSVLPFGELELKNRLLELQNALLRSGGPRRRGAADHDLPVQAFGGDLCVFLLPGEVRGSIATAGAKPSPVARGCG